MCARTGLSARTIRYYEEIGLLPGVRRRAGGRRVYGPDELERLGFIHRLKTLGLSLAEIRELNEVHGLAGSTEAMLRRLHDLLGAHLDDVDRRLAELRDLRDELAHYRDHVEARVSGRPRPDVRPGIGAAATARGPAAVAASGRAAKR
ncbi:MAG: MerR family transcriptional regulator [Spirochaetaceae bacterium]|nr:MerR family transcriptional regulator [Myxococcales bacterium]MCB9725405.1 MerR family transcriptional regulator [Spirochaetaceae bacterium]